MNTRTKPVVRPWLIVAVAFSGLVLSAVTAQNRRYVDLSHTIEHGMSAYPGLPAPVIEDHLSREQSRANYAPGTEFQIGKISMVANTGTYIDTPFHRFENGKDLAALDLGAVADIPGIVVNVVGSKTRAISKASFEGSDVGGKAVLVRTGWDAHWRTERYFQGHPFLTEDAARYLKEQGAVLVGIDSLNIDDTSDARRPVHTILLDAGIPIVEHLRGLEQLPASGFQFSAVPPKVQGMGTFPVRAFATIRSL